MTKIGVLGVGAVGSYYGAFAAKAGEDITLIDMWPEHVEHMKRNGLRASGSHGDFTTPVRAIHLNEVQRLVQDPFDVVFLSVKSYDTTWAATFIAPYVKPSGCVVSAQNCMNDDLLASIVGQQRAVGCVVSGITVALWEPGHVTRGGDPSSYRDHIVFRVGEHHGRITDRVREIVRILDHAEGAKATTNLWGERWSKLATNCMSNAMSGMSTLGNIGLTQDPRARYLRIHAGKEVVRVAQAAGASVEPISGIDQDVWADADDGAKFEELDAKLAQGRHGVQEWFPSMYQDLKKGRKTEIDLMNGHVVRKGRELGIATPYNAATVATLKDVEEKRRKASPANVERAIKMAEGTRR